LCKTALYVNSMKYCKRAIAPFKVIQNQRFLIQIDFQLVLNTKLLPILHRFRDIAFDKSKVAIFGYPSYVQTRWSGSLHHIITSDISLKLETLGYISVVERLRISSTSFTQCAAKAIEFAEITQYNGHYAVQCHSRSQILVPIESSYIISY